MSERSEWREEFLRYVEKERRLSPHTVAAYRRDLAQFAAFVDRHSGARDAPWGSVDRLVIRSFLGALAGRDLARTTIQRKLAAVRAFYAYLHRTDRVASNPARLVRTPRRERALPGYLSQERAAELFDGLAERAAAAGDFLSLRRWALLELLYSCGLRLAEARGLDLPQ
ncbi:MAG: site-specific integrase, partial [Gemmatimonadota bacterium]